VISLVSHAFLVQNRFYATQTLRTSAQDNVRALTEMMAREIRNTMDDGVMVAGARTLTIRSPLAMTLVCDGTGLPNLDVYNEGGELAISTDEVAGIALRDRVTGVWEQAQAGWSDIDGSTSDPAGNCFANGADTVGARDSFHRLRVINPLFAGTPEVGDVLMIFRETTFTIRTSELDPSTLGIFRGIYGDSLVEFATGIDTTAQFSYRMADGAYVDTVSASALVDVDAVRIVADARKPAPTGGADDVTFGWSVAVPLRTIR